MTFSSEVKQELRKMEYLSPCCMHAQSYGMLLFAKSFTARQLAFSSEDASLVSYYAHILLSQFSVSALQEQLSSRKYQASVAQPQDCAVVLQACGHEQREPNLRILHSNFQNNPCCYHAFLRGVFLACGTIASPQKNYHLEFMVSYKRLCMDFLKLMQEVELEPKYINRKGNHIIYFKDSEAIEDLLTIMGATNASLELMGVKMHKDMRNVVNRKLNFETANIGRTVDAAIQQVDAIEKIEQNGGIVSLPENLREIARVRLENPEASLRELTELLQEPLTRSGVNHRLARIIEYANSI